MGFIFLSYGHDRYSRLASQLKEDLKAKGYEVWYDLERLLAGRDWEQYIEDGLEQIVEAQNEGFLLFLMTLHSVRRPDGFCLNELAKACGKGVRNIIPLMVESGSVPPLSIFRLQNLDVRDCFDTELNLVQENYERHLARILEILRGRWQLDTEGADTVLRSLLPPIDFQTDWLGYEEFQGREWVFEKIDKWLSSDSPSRVFWIVGGPGVGKTALAIKICSKAEVIAYHFCKAENSEKKNPENLVKSIAYQMSTQIPEYREKLLDPSSRLEHTLSEYKDDPRELFKKLIVNALYGISMEPGVKKVIVIDAVDEANNAYSNDIAAFIRDEFKKTPSWLRLILTSRDDPLVNSDLAEYRSEAITIESPDNDNDILHYLEEHLKQIVPDGEKANAFAKEIAKKSQGMFLYAVEVMKSIRLGDLKLDKLDEFPIGMNAFYKRNYERRFPPNRPEEVRDYEERVLPLLNIIAAAMEPLDRETLKSVLNLSTQKEADRLFQKMGTLFIRTDRKLIPVHKSLMDWLVSDAAGIYKIYPRDGHGLLAEYGWKRLKEEEEYGWEEPFDYAIENIGIHLYASKERPEKDTTIRERLVELFKKSFAGSETENLPKTILRKLLDFVVAHQDENNEIVFKRELSNFVKNQKEQENQDSLFSLAVFLRERSDSYMVRSKPKWGKWLLDYQHKLLEELISSNPEVDEYNYALAESLIRIGDYERISGNTEKAHEDYLESRDIMIGLIEKNPDNFDWKHCFLISSCREIETGIHFVPVGLNCLFMLPIDVLKLNKLEQFLTDYDKNTFLGALYNQKCGEVEGPKYGEHYFRESIRILKGLITSGNTNSEIQGMLIKNHIHLGDCKKETGDLNEASEEYQMALHLVEKQTEQDPENTEWKRARCESWSKIADVERERNNLDRAFRACEEALKIAKGLSKVNDSHAGWKRVLWENWTKVADIERERGNLYQGLDACRVSTRILEELIALDPSQDVLFREQGESWILMGELADRNANENVYLEAFSEAEKCFGICSRDFERVRGLKETFYRKAVIEKVRGNLTNSKVLFEKCLEIDPNNNYSPCSLYSYIGLGEIESAFGNPLSGLNYFKNALSILPKSCKDKELELLYRTVDSVNTLIKRTSYSLEGDSEFRNNLANCWNQIGDIEKRRGQMQKALSAYHKDLSLLRCDRYRDQFSALYKIAEIERDSIPEKSIKWYYEAVSVLNHKRVISQAILPEIIDALGKLVELIGQNERYVYLVEDIAGIWGKIGDYERTRKNYEKAAEYYRNYYNIFNELIINKNNDTEMKILAICRKIASFSKRIDKKDAAKEWYKLVNNRSRELLIRYPDSFELIISFVSSLINLYSLSEESEKKVAFYNEAYQFTNTLILSGNKIKTLNQLKAFFVGNSKNPGNEGD